MITKKLKYLLIFIMLLSIGNTTVLANTNNNTVDFDKLGTISITLKENTEKKFIEGADLTIYHIATVTEKNSNLFYEYNENITNCNSDLTDLLNPNLASEITKCINNLELPSLTKTTNEEGFVTFDNLQLGLYLVKQNNQVEGYSTIEPFLVAIPKEENNIWIYDIKATPKTDIIRLMDIIVEKKWDIVNSTKRPDKVTIQLLKDNEVIDTVILNDENNWTHTWNQIEKSDTYSVKEIDIPAGYTATYRQVENKFIVTNTKTLVQTGQNILIIELLAFLGLILIVTGFVINKRKSYE